MNALNPSVGYSWRYSAWLLYSDAVYLAVSEAVTLSVTTTVLHFTDRPLGMLQNWTLM